MLIEDIFISVFCEAKMLISEEDKHEQLFFFLFLFCSFQLSYLNNIISRGYS